MSSLLISGHTQAVEDKRKLEERIGSKKPNGYLTLGCPIPDLRRRTSVAYTTWNCNVDRSLYYGNNNRTLLGVNAFEQRRVKSNKHGVTSSHQTDQS
jgi:hypothetical protein